jgi:histone deacetylase 1/2
MTSALQLSTSAGALASASAPSIPAGAIISAPTGSTLNTITVRLDRSNFLLWKMQVVPNIAGQGWYGFLDGSATMPPATVTEGSGADAVTKPNPDYANWFYTDQRVLSILVGSMTEEILGHLVGRSTSASVWGCLMTMFSAQNSAGARQMRRQLTSEKKNDLTADAYFHKMKGYADAMAMAGHPITDDELVDYIIVGLGPQYASLQHSLTVLAAAGADNLSLSAFYSMLLNCEKINEQNFAAPEFSTSANAVSRQGDATRGGGRLFVDNNGGRFGSRPTGQPSRGGQQQQSQGQRGNRPNQGGGGGGGNGGGGNSGGGKGGRRRNRPQCQICTYWGHDALQCKQRFNQAFQYEDNRAGNSAAYQAGTGQSWLFDTGATDHLTNDMGRMTVQERYTGTDQVQVANGSGLSITHVGHSRLPGSSSPIELKNILHVPGLSTNLLSVYRLVSDNDIFVEFHKYFFFVKDKVTKRILLRGRSRGGLYPLPFNRVSASGRQASSGIRLSSEQWHRRLGHPSNKVVHQIVSSNNLPCSSNIESSVCDACQRAKSHQLPYNYSTRVSTSPLELIHSDVWGPALPSSGGFKYYVSFIDDYSRYCWIYLIKHKSDVESIFYTFQNHVERLLNAKIRSVQSDWGGEYHRLHAYFERTGIAHRVSCPHTSQQNGIAERKHRHLVETGLALLAHSSLPLRFWDESCWGFAVPYPDAS